MDFKQVCDDARGNIGPFCKACYVCNGVACKNTIPGPGAKGMGDVAIRNWQKWQEVRVNMDTLCENAEVDTSVTLFGKKFSLPVFAGPVEGTAIGNLLVQMIAGGDLENLQAARDAIRASFEIKEVKPR